MNDIKRTAPTLSDILENLSDYDYAGYKAIGAIAVDESEGIYLIQHVDEVVSYHYYIDSNCSFHFSLLSEVGEMIHPFYDRWLEKNEYAISDYQKEIEGYPYFLEVLEFTGLTDDAKLEAARSLSVDSYRMNRFHSWDDEKLEDLDCLEFGSLRDIENRSNIDLDSLITSPLLQGSDYGGSDVTIANCRWIRQNWDELPGVYKLYGRYSSYGYAIRVRNLTNDIIEVLTNLSDYPLIDGDVHDEVRNELESNAWDSWVKADFTTEVENKFSIDLLDDDLSGLFSYAAEEANEYANHETGGSVYWNIDRIVESIELDDLHSHEIGYEFEDVYTSEHVDLVAEYAKQHSIEVLRSRVMEVLRGFAQEGIEYSYLMERYPSRLLESFNQPIQLVIIDVLELD
ncbi:hypothetical protein [Chroococcidiopsis sp.]|uniref:hypothetical protein n=1 Tax=Chroococcidiopsis sp. TaxID=3088168 RepID=UPI003F3A8C9B